MENLKQESKTTIRPSWVIKREAGRRSTKACRSVIAEAANALALNSALVSVQRFVFNTGEAITKCSAQTIQCCSVCLWYLERPWLERTSLSSAAFRCPWAASPGFMSSSTAEVSLPGSRLTAAAQALCGTGTCCPGAGNAPTHPELLAAVSHRRALPKPLLPCLPCCPSTPFFAGLGDARELFAEGRLQVGYFIGSSRGWLTTAVSNSY